MSVTLSENIIWDTHVVSTFSTALDGNGTPLQYSCLESPMDGGAWWAAVHGVTKGHTTEWLHFHFSLSCIGEGNGNLLQCSCLENPRDRGAWWAAVYGVAQSRTRLKWLSSSVVFIGNRCIPKTSAFTCSWAIIDIKTFSCMCWVLWWTVKEMIWIM